MSELANQSKYFDRDLNRDLLSITGFFSVLMHAVLILAVTFKLPEIGAQTSTDNTLDVVLLSRNNERSVDDADLISDTDNEGGGLDELEGSTTELYKPTDPSPIQSVEKRTDQTAVNTLAPDQYISANAASVSIQRQNPEVTQLKNKTATQGPDLLNTNARNLEMERLLAKLSKEQEEYAKRPKKKFHSPTTKASGAAKYLDAWREKVTRLGNANYPIQIKANNLHGSLTISVEIRSDGLIHKVQILDPSPHRILNQAALRIIRDAAPFESFPDEDYFKDTDILVITRMIHFLPDNQVTSTAVGRG